MIDITGVPTIDSTVANHLVQTVDASRLMGASVIITGLSPEIAQTLVTLGVELGKVNAVGDLQGGIEEAERLLGYTVSPEPSAGRRRSSVASMAVPILKQGPFLIASIQAALTDTDVLQLRDDVMAQVTRHRSRGIIVDVTALDVMDSFVSRSLRGIAMMTRLRGAETVIVGIQPEVAFAMVQLGMSFEDVQTALDLEEGLALLQARKEPATWLSGRADRDRVRRRRRDRAPAGARAGVGLELTSTDQTLLATAISEVARNITTYAEARRGAPRARARRRRPPRHPGVARDDGPGIEDLELALQDGYTTGGGLGLGLPGRAAAGRRVRHRDRARAGHDGHAGHVGETRSALTSWPRVARPRRGRRWRIEGEERSGDLAVFAPDRPRRARVRDRRARPRPRGGRRGRACARVVARARRGDARRSCWSAATRRCARRAASVMTLAWFDLERSHAVLGGRRQRRGAPGARRAPDAARGRRARASAAWSATTCRSVRAATMPLEPGDAVVMPPTASTPTISASLAGAARRSDRRAGSCATHGKGTDDALAAVVRYRSVTRLTGSSANAPLWHVARSMFILWASPLRSKVRAHATSLNHPPAHRACSRRPPRSSTASTPPTSRSTTSRAASPPRGASCSAPTPRSATRRSATTSRACGWRRPPRCSPRAA